MLGLFVACGCTLSFGQARIAATMSSDLPANTLGIVTKNVSGERAVIGSVANVSLAAAERMEGGNADLMYTWERTTDPNAVVGNNANYTTVAGATSSSLPVDATREAVWYRRNTRTVSGAVTVSTNWVQMNSMSCNTCANVTCGGIICSNTSGCGTNGTWTPPKVNSSSDPSGGTGGAIEYVWYKSTTDPAGTPNWQLISGATSNCYQPDPVSQTTWYYRAARRSGCTAYICSNYVKMTMNAGPSASITANVKAICAGGTAILTASGGTAYQWITGATTASISVSPTSTTVYTATVTGSNGCTTTATYSLCVNPKPNVTANCASICSGSSATLTASGASSYNWSTGGNSCSITVSPTANTTYTVTGTDSKGCTATTTTTVTVGTGFKLTVSPAGGASICSGACTTLSASGGNTYSWSNGICSASTTVCPTATTTYTVTATSTSGCKQTATVVVTVGTKPTIVANCVTVCGAGSFAQVCASGANSYSWSNGSTAACFNINPTANTSYTVTATGNGGCTATAVVGVTVNPKPTVTATNATICGGGTAQVCASGANSYVWSNGAATAASRSRLPQRLRIP